MNIPSKQSRGFTLIEVILVLAIAALIFLMIFIALPALQASQRDTSRKNDASLVSAAITSYTSAQRSNIDSGTNVSDIIPYVDKLDQYDKDTAISIAAAGDNPGENEILIQPASKCDGTQAATGTGVSDRQATVRIQLDKEGTYYCVDAA